MRFLMVAFFIIGAFAIAVVLASTLWSVRLVHQVIDAPHSSEQQIMISKTVSEVRSWGQMSDASSVLGFYTAPERDHLRDVHDVYAVVRVISIVFFVGWFVLLLLSRLRGCEWMYTNHRLLHRACIGVTVAAVIGGLALVLGFDTIFVAAHRMLFPGGNWEFPPESLLIQLFPGNFWLAWVTELWILTFIVLWILWLPFFYVSRELPGPLPRK